MTDYDTQTNPRKRKNVSPLRVMVNKWGFLLGGLMLGMGIIVGLAASMFVIPPLLGFDITSTALADREILLAATDADLNQRDRDALERETQFALDAQATGLDLFNAESLLDQTATQSTNNIIATATANAAENARQRTQIALDFAATRVELQRNATQVQLDFQTTQAAFNGQGSDDFDSQAAATLAITPTATPLPPTPTSTIMLPPPSDTPAPTAIPIQIVTDLAEGIDSLYWIASTDRWEQNERGIQAEANDAVLWSRAATWQENFTLAVDVAPAIVLESTYALLLNIADGELIAIQIDISGLAANRVQIVQLQVDFVTDISFDSEPSKIIAESSVGELLTSQTRFAVTIETRTVTVYLNETEILTADLPNDLVLGQVGVALPQGSILQTISVRAD
ncbi:MAG: hypothetical protein Q9P44_08395 [Anaerolineae bacterium]|nr:hypothetical protein [Anaerolineae bacterium]